MDAERVGQIVRDSDNQQTAHYGGTARGGGIEPDNQAQACHYSGRTAEAEIADVHAYERKHCALQIAELAFPDYLFPAVLADSQPNPSMWPISVRNMPARMPSARRSSADRSNSVWTDFILSLIIGR